MEIIQTKIIQIGNSKGIRLPKHILEQLNIRDKIELIVDSDAQQIHIKPINSVREGWEEAFQKFHESGDDDLIIDDNLDLTFDLENWEW